MSESLRPTLTAALAELHNGDAFKVVLDFIRECRENRIADFSQADTPNLVMKTAGQVAFADELLEVLRQ